MPFLPANLDSKLSSVNSTAPPAEATASEEATNKRGSFMVQRLVVVLCCVLCLVGGNTVTVTTETLQPAFARAITPSRRCDLLRCFPRWGMEWPRSRQDRIHEVVIIALSLLLSLHSDVYHEVAGWLAGSSPGQNENPKFFILCFRRSFSSIGTVKTFVGFGLPAGLINGGHPQDIHLFCYPTNMGPLGG